MEFEIRAHVSEKITNNTMKFVSEKSNEFCRKKSINKHRIVIGTTKLNNLVEHMKLTILERLRCIRLRCMLSGVWFPKTFWNKVVSTTTYLIKNVHP